MSAKPETIVEIVGAILYSVFMYQQITGDGDLTYARIMHSTARVCQSVARRIGQWGISAELEYRKAIDAGRMN